MQKAKILFVEDEMISAATLEDGVSPFLGNFVPVIIGILILFGLYLSSLYNFLLFHILAELFIILVSWTIFIIVWNCRRITPNSYFLFLGIAYLFIGGLELIHTGRGGYPKC